MNGYKVTPTLGNCSGPLFSFQLFPILAVQTPAHGSATLNPSGTETGSLDC